MEKNVFVPDFLNAKMIHLSLQLTDHPRNKGTASVVNIPPVAIPFLSES